MTSQYPLVKMASSKAIPSIFVGMVLLLGWMNHLPADLRVSHRSDEQRSYELDRQRASDIEQAWRSLASGLDDEHYIRLVASSSSLTGDYRKFEVTSVSAQGSMLTIQLQKIEDEDKKRGLSLRATEILRLELLERPW